MFGVRKVITRGMGSCEYCWQDCPVTEEYTRFQGGWKVLRTVHCPQDTCPPDEGTTSFVEELPKDLVF